MTASTERPRGKKNFLGHLIFKQPRDTKHTLDWLQGSFLGLIPGMGHRTNSLYPVNTSVFSWSLKPRTLKCWELCTRGCDRDRFLTIKQEKWDLVELILEQEQLKPFQKLGFLMALLTTCYGPKPAPWFWVLSTLYSVPSTGLAYQKPQRIYSASFIAHGRLSKGAPQVLYGLKNTLKKHMQRERSRRNIITYPHTLHFHCTFSWWVQKN